MFASEIKGVLAHPAVPRELDERAISAYLTFGYVPDAVHLLRRDPTACRPAHVLTLEPGGEPRIERYWSSSVPAR